MTQRVLNGVAAVDGPLTTQTATDTVPRWQMNANSAVMFWGDGSNTFDSRIDRVAVGELNFFGTGAATQTRWWVGSAAQAFQSEVAVRAAAGQQKALSFYSGGTPRWVLRSAATAESGGNAGADLEISARDDTGAALTTPLSIRRSDGQISFGGLLRSTGVAAAGTATQTRQLGGVNGAAPSNATFAYVLGDWAIDITGGIWVCTAGGTGANAQWILVRTAQTTLVSSGPFTALGPNGFLSNSVTAAPDDHVHGALYTRVFRNTAFSVPSGVDTPIQYNVKENDDANWFTTATPDRLTVPVGLYAVSATIRFGGSTVLDKERALWIRGGATRFATANAWPSAASQPQDLAVSTVMRVTVANTTIQAMAWQSTGAALSTDPATNGLRMTVAQIG